MCVYSVCVGVLNLVSKTHEDSEGKLKISVEMIKCTAVTFFIYLENTNSAIMIIF